MVAVAPVVTAAENDVPISPDRPLPNTTLNGLALVPKPNTATLPVRPRIALRLLNRSLAVGAEAVLVIGAPATPLKLNVTVPEVPVRTTDCTLLPAPLVNAVTAAVPPVLVLVAVIVGRSAAASAPVNCSVMTGAK